MAVLSLRLIGGCLLSVASVQAPDPYLQLVLIPGLEQDVAIGSPGYRHIVRPNTAVKRTTTGALPYLAIRPPRWCQLRKCSCRIKS